LRRRGLRDPAGRKIDAEQLDDPHAEPAAVRAPLADIAPLNRLFGGTRAIVDALEPFFQAGTGEGGRGKGPERWTLLDVGTGGGDIPCAAATCASDTESRSPSSASSGFPQPPGWPGRRASRRCSP